MTFVESGENLDFPIFFRILIIRKLKMKAEYTRDYECFKCVFGYREKQGIINVSLFF